jgi:hypothetical protein
MAEAQLVLAGLIANHVAAERQVVLDLADLGGIERLV